MPSTNPFVVKFAFSIIAVLGCHDRLIFKGHLPFSDEAHLNRFVDHSLRIRRKDFLAFAAEKSERLVTSAKGFAAQHGRAPGGAGHSMGMLINEPPMIAPWDETILTPGLVIGLELGPVETEGMFITEELLQVTPSGYDRLTAEAPTLIELDF